MGKKTLIQVALTAMILSLAMVTEVIAMCEAPVPIVKIVSINTTFTQGNPLPFQIQVQVQNISNVDRDFLVSVRAHGHLMAQYRTGLLAPQQLHDYVYNGPEEDWMWDGFKHRVTVTIPQNTAFFTRNPARKDAILEMPGPQDNGTISIDIPDPVYLGNYKVDIKTTLHNISSNNIQVFWAVVLHGTANLRPDDQVSLEPSGSLTYHEIVDLRDYFDQDFLDNWGPYPLRVMSCSMGFCRAAFFVADDMCHCQPEICGNGIDEDCTGVADDNCRDTDSVLIGLEWQKTGHFGQFTQAQADDYCASLSGEGWRLPTKDELKGIVYCSNGVETPLEDGQTCGTGYQWPTILPQFTSSLAKYWSSTREGDNFWMVNFFNGKGEIAPPDTTGNVRCVRTLY